jgi:hypothetical protein
VLESAGQAFRFTPDSHADKVPEHVLIAPEGAGTGRIETGAEQPDPKEKSEIKSFIHTTFSR